MQYILMNKTYKTISLPQLRKQKMSSIDLNYQKQGQQDTKKVVQIGQYIVNKQQLLGRGFSSQVYKAQHKTKGFFAAAKMIQLEQIHGKIQSRLVKNQIRNMHLLKNSKNVNKLYNVLTTKKYVVFFTQLCRQSLSSKLKINVNHQVLPFDQILRIFKDILKGYFCMRKLELLHRDLKPANILLGFSGEAFLGDFGFCIKDNQVLEDKYVKIGSPLYMAPQVLSSNLYSEKADIWSIGMILLEMSVKEIPWKTAHEKDLLHIFQDLQISNLFSQDFDQRIKQIIEGCLIVDPAKRLSLIAVMEKTFNEEENHIFLNSFKKNEILDKNVCETFQNILKNTKTQESVQTNKLRTSSFSGNRAQMIRSKNLFRLTPDKFAFESVKRSAQQYSKKTRQTLRISERERELLDFKLRTQTVDPEEALLKIDKNELLLCSLIFRIIELSTSQSSNIHIQMFKIDKQFIIELSRKLVSLLQKVSKSQNKQISNVANEYLKKYCRFFEKNIQQEIIALSFNGSLLAKGLSEYITNVQDHFVLIYQEVKKCDLQLVRDIQICRFMQLVGAIMEAHKLSSLYQKGRRTIGKYVSKHKLQSVNKKISFTQIENLYQKLKMNF